MQPPNNIFHVLLVLFIWFTIFPDFIIQQRSREHFNLLLLLSRNFNKCNNFVTLTEHKVKNP